MSLFLWSQNAANNATADPSINFAEGQTPGSVNNSARQLMKSIAEWRDDTNGSLVLGGGTTSYTLSTNQSFISLIDGLQVTFEVNATNTDAVTFNVDGLGAKSLLSATGNELVLGDLPAGAKFSACFDLSADCWKLINFTPTAKPFPTGTLMLFAQTSAPVGWTKNTDHDEHTLRVVSGDASIGGTLDFSAVFSSQDVAGTVGETVLTEAQLPDVSLQLETYIRGDHGTIISGVDMDDYTEGSIYHENSGHTGSGTSTARSGGGVLVEFGSDAPHDHSFTGTAIDLDIKYLDVILCEKD